MATPGFQWVKSPDVLARNIEKYGDKIFVAIRAIADFIATEAQEELRVYAPWEDRTGNARSGLFSIAEQVAAGVVVIYLSHGHTIEYGIHLELDHGGLYAIIEPTMFKIYPDLERMLEDLLS